MEFRPISVSIVIPDDSARLNTNYLLVRDVRTTILTNHDTVFDLCQQLRKKKKLRPNVVLIDLAVEDQGEDLPRYMAQLKAARPDTTIVFISENDDYRVLLSGLKLLPHGLILKDDVQVALSSALMQAHETGFVYTPSAAKMFQRDDPRCDPKHRMEKWVIHPDLRNRYAAILWLCIIEGLKTRVVAYELGRRLDQLDQPRWRDGTIEKYRTEIYEVIEDGFYDLTYLQGAIDNEVIGRFTGEFRGDEWAFHIVTQPPNPNHPVYSCDLENTPNIRRFYMPYQ
ncbi:MAG: hypothetical protein ACPG8W_00795 [Candidatus Promineifilaceae bacterium]